MDNTATSRDQRRTALRQALKQLERVSLDPALAAHLATGDAWRGQWAGRQGYSYSRRNLARAATDLQELLDATAEALMQVHDLLETYPAAHDDDTDNPHPGYCTCGRWSNTCPARKALARGALVWEAEDGQLHPVTEGVDREPSL